MPISQLGEKAIMKIIPAIDILDGRCAQLLEGRLGTEKFYGNPLKIALKWESIGAELLHVVDLDATLGKGNNTNSVISIKKSVKIPIHFGGGIRDFESAKGFLDSGIDKIILGTLAVHDYFNNFKVLRKLSNEFGSDRIIVALDSKDRKIVVKGWQEKTELNAIEFAKYLEDIVWGFLYTDVDVEGRMSGINLEGIREIVKSTKLPVVISGGISSYRDIEKLKEVGAWGAVLGKALYERKIDIKRFLKVKK